MSPIERVARALHEEDRAEIDPCWEEDAMRHPAYFVRARTAILALREPTEEMVGAGSNAFFEGPLDDRPSEATRMAFTAMIDKAAE